MGNYKRSSGVVSTIIIAILSVYLILFGAGIYLNDAVFEYNAIAIGAILIIFGVILMTKFFMNEEYKNPTNYGFSLGVMLLLIGGFVILNTKAIVRYTPAYVGIIILVLGIVVLQHAFAMKFMESKSFASSLIFSILIIISAVLILLDVQGIASSMDIFFSALCVCCGILCIVSMICIKVSAKNFATRLNIKYERMMEERPDSYAEYSAPKTSEKKKSDEMEDSNVNANVTVNTNDILVENAVADDCFEE